jgi:amidophosphoribosyltransferase
MEGSYAIGHVRYSTSGDKKMEEIQPFLINLEGFGDFAVAHNGNLTNAQDIKKDLELNHGVFFASNSDTECIIRLMALSQKTNVYDKFKEVLGKIKGAFSLVAVCGKQVFIARDPNAIRPLSIGKIGDAWVASSETCAFDLVNAEFVREVAAGELILINEKGELSREIYTPAPEHKFCVFEFIYFARPDSILQNECVYEVRKKFGEILAKKAPVEADIISPVPDSGLPAAIGFSNASGIPFELGIIRNHYTGRTFINPTQQIRENKVKLKHNPNHGILKGKRVILVDDSIVRGTTSRKVVKLMFEAGATEVHLRISSPPTAFPCFYGIDTPTKEELIYNRFNGNIEQICEYLGCTSLAYLSLEDVYNGLKATSSTFCDACFTGKYFVKPPA